MKFSLKTKRDRAFAEMFLMELANLRMEPDSAQRLLEKYKSFFPPEIGPEQREVLRETVGAEDLFSETVSAFTGRFGDVPQKELLVWVLWVGKYLQSVWGAPDWQTAAWRWFWMRIFAAQMFGHNVDSGEPPPMTPFQTCLFHLWSNFHNALQCGNPDCAAPCFFRKKKGQRYCSDLCAEHGQREAKKRWWTEHGERWRQKRERKGR